MKTTVSDQAPSQNRSATKFVWVVLVTFLISGCSEKSQAPQSGGTTTKGKIVIKGSNTIGEELTPRLIAEFKKEHSAASIEMESKLTGYGLAALLADQCNVAAASRHPIKDELDLAK